MRAKIISIPLVKWFHKMINKRDGQSYMEEDTDGMASTDRVVILTQVALECIGISGLYDIHSHVVQGLYGLVDGSMLLVIVCITEPVHLCTGTVSFLHIQEYYC